MSRSQKGQGTTGAARSDSTPPRSSRTSRSRASMWTTSIKLANDKAQRQSEHTQRQAEAPSAKQRQAEASMQCKQDRKQEFNPSRLSPRRGLRALQAEGAVKYVVKTVEAAQQKAPTCSTERTGPTTIGRLPSRKLRNCRKQADPRQGRTGRDVCYTDARIPEVLSSAPRW